MPMKFDPQPGSIPTYYRAEEVAPDLEVCEETREFTDIKKQEDGTYDMRFLHHIITEITVLDRDGNELDGSLLVEEGRKVWTGSKYIYQDQHWADIMHIAQSKKTKLIWSMKPEYVGCGDISRIDRISLKVHGDGVPHKIIVKNLNIRRSDGMIMFLS